MNEESLFGEVQPDIILCRTENYKAPIKTQADQFAAALLMPRKKVARLFYEMRGKTGAVCIGDLTQEARNCRYTMNYLYPKGSYSRSHRHQHGQAQWP